MRHCFLAGFWFWLAVVCCGQAVMEVTSQRYPISYKNEILPFPFESSHDLFASNSQIYRVLVLIHGSSYNPKDYYNTGLLMLDHAANEKERTIVIAPCFLEAVQLDPASKPDFLYWEIRPFWGTSRGTFEDHNVVISAFDVIDIILKNLVDSNHFPNLREIIILGHSAGGQMVNRYAACNVFEDRVAKPNNITVKYVVTAPSSYVYMSKDRPIKGSLTRFAVPENADAGYNNWGWGLENLYSYHRRNRVTSEWMFEHYPQKKILYLVGSLDNNENDGSLGKGAGSVLQGANRLIRGRLYYNHLKYIYGDQIKGNQYFCVIKNVGHWGRGLMTSPVCVKFVFDRKTEESQ